MFQLFESLVNDRTQMSTPEWLLLVGSCVDQNTPMGRMMVNLCYAPKLLRDLPTATRLSYFGTQMSEGDDANIASGVNMSAIRDQVQALCQSCKADLDILRTILCQTEAEIEAAFREAQLPVSAVTLRSLQLIYFKNQGLYYSGLIITIIYIRLLAALYRQLENDDDDSNTINPINSVELESEVTALSLEVLSAIAMKGDKSGPVGSALNLLHSTIASGYLGEQGWTHW